MCGRFVSASPPDELARYFGADLGERLAASSDEQEPNYNVAPTATVPAVRAVDGHRQLEGLRWGLVPFWAKDLKIGSRLINARSETVADKPAFRRAVRRRRCLIPADGFYEWAKITGRKTKQPYYIHRTDGDRLVFAGLWERWSPSDEKTPGVGSDPAETIESCVILTTAANADVAPVHDRMPVLVSPDRWDDWLDPASELDFVQQLLHPAPAGLLTLRPVSTLVNRVSNRGARLIEEVPLLPVEAEDHT